MATGSLFFSPYFQFTDASGVPYAGGSLAFYSSGTNTPLAVYADQELTTPLQNPVPLNSAGWPEDQIWLQTQEYRVVLSDVNGVQIWAADPVAAGGQFTGSVVVSGTGQVGFTAVNLSANGNTWGWYSQTDGTFNAIDSNNGAIPISINNGGTVTFSVTPIVVAPTTVGIVLTSTAVAGQEWALYSADDGSFSLFNSTNAVTPFYVLPDGNVTFQEAVTFGGVTTFNQASAFEQPVTMAGPFYSTYSAAFSATTTFTATETHSGAVGFSGTVTFSGGSDPLITGTGTPGLEITNTSWSGRSWTTYVNSSGVWVLADQTAGLSRMYLDSNGVVTMTGGGDTGTGSYGYLANTGAGTQTGTYSYGLNVTGGITSTIYSATSDRRLKSKIENITEDDAWSYVMAARPVTYRMDGISGAGFIAQEEAKGPRAASVATVSNISLEETIDEDGFVSPAGFQLTKNYDHDIAYLTRAIQSLKAELEAIKKGSV